MARRMIDRCVDILDDEEEDRWMCGYTRWRGGFHTSHDHATEHTCPRSSIRYIKYSSLIVRVLGLNRNKTLCVCVKRLPLMHMFVHCIISIQYNYKHTCSSKIKTLHFYNGIYYAWEINTYTCRWREWNSIICREIKP